MTNIKYNLWKYKGYFVEKKKDYLYVVHLENRELFVNHLNTARKVIESEIEASKSLAMN